MYQRLAAVCVAVWLGCGPADAPPTPPPPEHPALPGATQDWGRAGELVNLGAIQAPRRTHDDGTPDSCELLGNADPRSLLGADLVPALVDLLRGTLESFTEDEQDEGTTQ